MKQRFYNRTGDPRNKVDRLSDKLTREFVKLTKPLDSAARVSIARIVANRLLMVDNEIEVDARRRENQ